MKDMILESRKYSQIYQKIVKSLSPKVKYVFERRFGIKTGNPETLEAIGKTLGITRERVRQIEESGFNFIKKNYKDTIENIFSDINNYFENWGGARKEKKILEELGGKKYAPYVLFFLCLNENFSKIAEKKDHYSFWSNLPNAKTKIVGILTSLVSELKKIGEPVKKEDFYQQMIDKYNFTNNALSSYLEISKKIQMNQDGLIGLTEWPEIKPRGVKDRAYLVLKKENKPLHFTKIVDLIATMAFDSGKKAHPRTVHNELIKDPRFVLVGRGIYALAEWGYYPGTIRDVISKILQEHNQPLSKDEIIQKVLTQRIVSKNTILTNLNNKKYFQKVEDNKYFLRRVEEI